MERVLGMMKYMLLFNIMVVTANVFPWDLRAHFVMEFELEYFGMRIRSYSQLPAIKLFDWLLFQRVTIPEILEDEWFKKDYKPPVLEEEENTNSDDVETVFKDSEETRFASKCPSNEIFHKIEAAVKALGFDVYKKNYKTRLQNMRTGRKGSLNIATEVCDFERKKVAPSLYTVEVRYFGVP
ncbi:hypothetical protein K2173_025028 [Erythroxylum novogranatense]|uniref:NAF domain-containing protein n=1 Tax=Erythroxylum novogranatense TaxID=1862640 RepID=A0AAV8UFS4_9ROSI|nr:hypothetical protein K2173_025028 [Erythroxylum novogranatense]